MITRTAIVDGFYCPYFRIPLAHYFQRKHMAIPTQQCCTTYLET